MGPKFASICNLLFKSMSVTYVIFSQIAHYFQCNYFLGYDIYFWKLYAYHLQINDIKKKYACLYFQPAHVKACFLGSNLTVPVSDGKLNLGTWQGVWLCEHRDRAGSRKILVTVNGALRDPDRTPLSPNSPIASTSS